MTTATLGYQVLPLGELHESKQNPRRHFNADALAELAASIRTKGVLTPLLVRPNAAGYEIAAGHRRYRAAKLAGVDAVPIIVQELTDVEFLEILTIENLQREDVHPLEEAAGYQQLLDKGGYDVARIAERVGKSIKYVYDRMKLLSLTKDAQQLFLEDKITAGHAILLARLKPEDQARAIGKHPGADGGLFVFEHTLWDPFDDGRGEPPLKARSVRELQGWIDKHVKFDAAAADPMLFPDTVETVTAAKEDAEKVVSVTYDHAIHPDARDGQRVLGPRSWKRADGTKGAKRCDHAITGVIVIGAGRGEAFKVCVAKEKCATHWAEEQKASKARAIAATKQGKTGEERWKIDERKRKEQEARDEAERARWTKAEPAILEAIAAKVKTAPTKASGLLAEVILGAIRTWGKDDAARYVSRGASAEDFVRYAAFRVLRHEIGHIWSAPRDFPKRAKAFGVDVKKILDEVAPVKSTDADAEAKKKTRKK